MSAAPVMQLQGELGFQANGANDGHAKWVALRQMNAEMAAQKLNLPLGHQTEVWLRGGIRLRGKLHLVQDFLFIEEERIRQLPLTMDGISFTYSEIESCIQLD